MTIREREGTRLILEALKAVIETSGLTITEVAQRAQVTRQYLHQILADRTNPTLETVERIFEACSDSFGNWLKETSTERFGRHNPTHEILEKLLKLKGEPARTTTNMVDSLAALYLRPVPDSQPRPNRQSTLSEKVSTNED